MLWALAAGSALIYWVLSQSEGESWFRSGIKGLSVAPLALWALLLEAPLAALALALCSLGDVILSRPGERAFLGGLIAFALGHLAWIALFLLNMGFYGTSLLSFPWGLFALLLLILAAGVAQRIVPAAGALRGPVIIYVAIILATGLTGLATLEPRIAAGVLAFAVSDALLGLQTFGLTKGSTVERRANALIWPFYWGAIVLLTLGSVPL